MKKSSLVIKYVNLVTGEANFKTHEGYNFTALTEDNKSVDLFVFKEENGTWNATEPQSTSNVAKADTRKGVVELAQSRIGARPFEEFNRAVGNAKAVKGE